MKAKWARLILLAATWEALSVLGFAVTSITSSSATPSTITFTASNPDSPTVSGSSTATISFTTTGGSNTNTWSVQVSAATTNFGSCPSAVAATRVRVTCASATVSGGGGTGSCSGPFNLATSLTTVASGVEATGSRTYTVTLNFTFTDSWGFIATTSACTLGLSYLITAP